MIVNILLFARLKREAGIESARIEVSESATVRDVADAVERAYGVSLSGCMIAVDERYATADTPVSQNVEIAFLPPVAGGAGDETRCLVRSEPLSLDEAQTFLVRPEWGAQSYFVGTVRSPNKGIDISYLRYEAYAPMAIRVMRDAVDLARQRHACAGIYIAHRVGELRPAEPSIVIGVGSPHRRAAIEACDFLIEHLKVYLPVWKLEVGENGEQWVEGTTGAPVL
ncbi:molybdenum cofactor biosynthesis protein [Deinococcus yavapaiensis]|uniref:Molybdopterin synthase subunit MoaE /molybdopterin synthase subunit MoaD n=1 Tax=Deinococcus yavapaiensis KR-236 TaxID=694435 RepID=A0A318S646_9DEIO|nr:molybdenum cofactor biosynthesis protein MoaE [Deinococcus yavapaiensis]PYE54262.1 molybdopterin synthase subunit MoaE /molybdopterin synthase subunit MoaD [Deinococcus yavapaiensis KR-236]